MEKTQTSRSSSRGTVCEKLCNAVSGSPAFRSIRRISYRSQSPLPMKTTAQPTQQQLKPADHAPAKARVCPSKPVPLHQPCSGEMVPIEFQGIKPGASMEKSDKVTPASARIQPAGPPASNLMPLLRVTRKQDPNSTQAATTVLPVPGKGKDKKRVEIVSPAKTKAGKSQDEGGQGKKFEPSDSNDKFSGYIDRVNNKMRAPSNINGVGRTATRRDSFNDKVANYINRAKFKIRATSSMNDGKNVPFKAD